jgi:sugar lactone lactonase YvrE
MEKISKLISLLIFISCCVGIIFCSSAQSDDYSFVTKWGSLGSGDSQFNNPFGIAVDSSDHVYVAEYNNHRIQKFTSDGSFITKWGTFGNGDSQFNNPFGITLDSSSDVYVTDNGGSIKKFTAGGVFITKWGSPGNGDSQFNSPYGIVVDLSGNVYVADSRNSRIQKFTSTGSFLGKWELNGTGDGKDHFPAGIAVDSSGNVYVSDYYNACIQKFTSGGTFVTKWGSSGTGNSQFYYPDGIAVDSQDNVYVCDTQNHRIQKFSSTGSFITKWGSYGSADGQFYLPVGITVDSVGNVYVSEFYNHRVQKFAPSQNTASTTTITNNTSTIQTSTTTTIGGTTSIPAQSSTTSSVPPGAGITIKLDPATIGLPAVGNTFSVNITVENVEGLGGFQFDVTYNPAVVIIENSSDVVLENFLGSTGRTTQVLGPIIDNTAGNLTFGGFSFGTPPGPSGSGVLATVTFTVQNRVGSSLDLAKIGIIDKDGNALPVATIGSANLTESTPNTTTTSISSNCSVNNPVDCGNGVCCPNNKPYCGSGKWTGRCFAIPRGNFCSATFLFGADTRVLDIFRYLRDDILERTPAGRDYGELFYKHSPELIMLFMADPELKALTRDFLNNNLIDMLSILAGDEITISNAKMDEIEYLCETIKSKASPELQVAIEKFNADLRTGVILNTNGIPTKQN